MADYHIANVTQLQAMNTHLADDCILDNDIDARSFAFVSVGTFADPFMGSFDGQGYKIHGLTINQPAADYVGLFGCTAGHSGIHDVAVRSCNIIGRRRVGALVGENDGDVSNCWATGNVKGHGGTSPDWTQFAWIGGLIGYTIGGEILNCHTNIYVTTFDDDFIWGVGGLIGRAEDGSGAIRNCYTTGKTTTGNATLLRISDVGGLIGYLRSGSPISGCYALGNVETGDALDAADGWILNIGGLIGTNSRVAAAGSDVSDCYAKGNIIIGNWGKWNHYVGGLIGIHSNADISDCYATGNVPGQWYVGGLIGLLDGKDNNRHVLRCYATGNITCGIYAGSSRAGGLIGGNDNDSNIEQCYATGDVVGSGSYVGGLIGSNSDLSDVTDSYAFGKVTCTGDFYVGGLIGQNNAGLVTRCCARNHVDGGDMADAVGGLIGYNNTDGVLGDTDVEQSYSRGIVEGYAGIGGLIGSNNEGNIRNCYSQSEVKGEDMLGGLIGVHADGVTEIRNCYSSGKVTGPGADIGGLIGAQWFGAPTIVACFWDTETSGQPTSAGGTGKTTAQMKTKATFFNAGWNFITIWDILSYPGLRGVKHCDPVEEGGNYQIRLGKYFIKCEADKQNLLEANFTLRQNGGCAEFSIVIGAPDFTIALGNEVVIYLFGQAAPWYRGRVLERSREGSSSRIRAYAGYGHFEFLSGGDLVDVTYGTGQPINDLRLAIIDILDTYVRPHSPYLTNINTKIVVPPTPIQEMKFDKVKPIDALTDLCELATGYEFGVDEASDFYFRLESSTILEHKWVGKHVATFLPTEDMRKLVNRWYLEGGDLVAGTNYDSLVENLASQGIYQLRSDKATIPSGMNNQEIARWGADLLAKTDLPKVKATTTGIDIERTRTRIWPRGQMRLTGEDGLPAPPDSFPIRTVTYHITPKGITADVELGEKKASITDPIATLGRQIKKEQEQLAHDVEQLADGTGIMPDTITETHFQPMPLVYLALFKDEL